MIGCLSYFHTWCGLSANLGCRSQTCCTRLAANTGRKKVSKKSPSAHRSKTLSGYIFATKHVSTIGNNLFSSSISSRCPRNMVNVGLLKAEIGPVVWGTPLISMAFASWQRYCTAVKYSERQPNFAALNRRCHLYSAGRPSRRALTHILVRICSSQSISWRNAEFHLWVQVCVPDKTVLIRAVCSSFFFFLSSPNLSRRRLDVYHTCTHRVALVRI